MSELDDFLTTTLARQIEADEALHNGDVTPRMQMWSTQDPVTVFGALKSASGWDEVSQAFRWIGSRCDCVWLGWHDLDETAEHDRSRSVLFCSNSPSLEGPSWS